MTEFQYNTIQYIENLYSAAIQKCPGALTILKYIKTKIKSICDECTLEQKCLKPFLEYICVTAVLQVFYCFNLYTPSIKLCVCHSQILTSAHVEHLITYSETIRYIYFCAKIATNQ